MQKFKMAAKNGGKLIFGRSISCGSKISTKSRTVSEINVFLLFFMQKFKMAAKMAGKRFWEKSPVHPENTMGIKNFDEIIPSRTISEINVVLHFMQKFKMAATTIFGKNRQFTLRIPWG